MTQRQMNNAISKRALTGAIVIGITAGLPGCAANPVFVHRFSHCMNAMNRQEAPDATIYPKGISKSELCWGWARQNLPSVAIAAKPQKPSAAALTESGK
ncbi:MAG: hypothetical protein OES38_21475 [Gammaproteobacteria bacterium]|nr:hypothetical protein [Gammaproteobacteria bacterium]